MIWPPQAIVVHVGHIVSFENSSAFPNPYSDEYM